MTETEIQEAVKLLYLEGKTLLEIAQQLKIGKNRIRNYIKTNNWVLPLDIKQLKKEKTLERAQKTFLRNWGVTNPSHSPEVISKIKNTFQNSKNSNPEFIKNLREKVKQTNIERYGVDNYAKSPECWKKSQKTILEKRGRLLLQNHIQNYDNYNADYILKNFITNDNKLDVDSICEYYQISHCHLNKLKKRWNIKIPNKTIYKSDLEKFLESLNCDSLDINNRTIIKPLEIDFILNNKLAIEFDGILFHSETQEGYRELPFQGSKIIPLDRNYHLNKTLLANKQKLDMLHILDIEWNDPVKNSIWKSIILNKLGKSQKIFARKCEIREVSTIEAKCFLEGNHLQGNCNSIVKIGLYYQGELVSLMTFGKPRFNKKYQWELLRFCCKLNTSVVGGASKLFKYFLKNYNPSNIISYANRRWSKGHLYESLGFKLIKETSPNYFYYKKNNIIKTRYQCQKHKLQLFLDDYDSQLTEVENMFKNGWRRFFDCGNLVYSLIIA